MYFSYDYKMDLEKTAVERERVFRLKNIREETVESDDEALFGDKPEEIPEEPEVVEETKKGKKEKLKKIQYEEIEPEDQE